MQTVPPTTSIRGLVVYGQRPVSEGRETRPTGTTRGGQGLSTYQSGLSVGGGLARESAIGGTTGYVSCNIGPTLLA